MDDITSINNEIPALTKDQERMRRGLRYHFMNPKEKWQAKGTLPIKMILIFIKLFLITIQLVNFSQYYVNEVNFFEGSQITFKHLFLKDWDWSLETPSYPPSHGEFALYEIDGFYKSVTYALENYYKLVEKAIGPYSFGYGNKPRFEMCVWAYNISKIFPWNRTYHYSNQITKRCIFLEPLKVDGNVSYDSKKILEEKNFDINFNGVVKVILILHLRSVQLKAFELDQRPKCYQFNITIIYDNSNHNGQMIMDLKSTYEDLRCSDISDTAYSKSTTQDLLFVLDLACVMFSILSFLLSSRSVYRLFSFWRRTKTFFLTELGADVSNKWKQFFSISYCLILIGDSLNIVGTLMKITFYNTHHVQKNPSYFIACSYLFGLGVFIGYCSILRYFTYFPRSSILINTIRISFWPLIRFSFCSFILYMAFSLIGWVTMGPYHIKFRTLQSSIACLFSLMNGDDMYVTLSIINNSNQIVYGISQLCIYLFCILFIVVVLNVILTIIIESYEQVKHNRTFLNSKSDIFWDFINSCPETAKSVLFRYDQKYEHSISQQRYRRFLNRCLDTVCCCIGHGSHTSEFESRYQNRDNKNDRGETWDGEMMRSNFFDGMPLDHHRVDDGGDHNLITNRFTSYQRDYGSMHHGHPHFHTYYHSHVHSHPIEKENIRRSCENLSERHGYGHSRLLSI